MSSDLIGPRPEQAGRDAATNVAFIVDDDPAALALLCDIAEEAGWASRRFTRLRELRVGLRKARPDILILDDDLPDGSGGDLARELRDDPSMGRMPVVVCTGAHAVRRAEITSWAPVLSKPFLVEELESFLRAARRRASGRLPYRAAG